MTLKEAQELKRVTERKIIELLDNFNKETGLPITEIYLQGHETIADIRTYNVELAVIL